MTRSFSRSPSACRTVMRLTPYCFISALSEGTRSCGCHAPLAMRARSSSRMRLYSVTAGVPLGGRASLCSEPTDQSRLMDGYDLSCQVVPTQGLCRVPVHCPRARFSLEKPGVHWAEAARRPLLISQHTA